MANNAAVRVRLSWLIGLALLISACAQPAAPDPSQTPPPRVTTTTETPPASTAIATPTITASPSATARTSNSSSVSSEWGLSSSDNLYQKRYISAGERAYVIGTASGDFPPMGWHIRGEMGGVWAHPIKLLDGYRFAIDRRWLPNASTFTTGAGYVQMSLPPTAGLEIQRTEFVPENLAAVLVGLTLKNAESVERTVTLDMFLHSEIMGAYPWDSSKPNTAKELNGTDETRFDAATGRITFKEPDQEWHALVEAQPKPDNIAINVDAAKTAPLGPPLPRPHSGGQSLGKLSWQVALNSGQQITIWIAIAGSHLSQTEASTALNAALDNPPQQLQDKIHERMALLNQTNVTLPDPQLQAAFDWGKLNLADMRRNLRKIEIRDVDQARAFPPPVATIAELDGIAAGYPDYPNLFGTDGAYTAYPLIASGQWETAMAHLRAIRDVSRAVNGDTGKVIHEFATDGSVYLGANDDEGNTNETAQFATAVELVWEWSGDNRFRDDMYEFVSDGLRYITSTLDANGNGCPEGLGMVERPLMAVEKLDVTVYTWQALQALTSMAASKGDIETATWAKGKAQLIEAEFDKGWWNAEQSQYVDSTRNCADPDEQLFQRHWINAIPMEVGLAPKDRADAALAQLESSNRSGDTGLYHTGKQGGADGKGELRTWTLPSSVMAVAQANYGRLDQDQALRYMRAIAAQLNLEMPGSLPEIAPSPDYDPFAPLADRAMFMQAWSAYGVQWPVIHHFLGVRPDIPAGALMVVPQIPPTWPGLSVEALRVGQDAIAVDTRRDGQRFSTTVEARGSLKLTIGHVVPPAAEISSVTLNDAPAAYRVQDTLRGREILVETTTGSPQTLVVTLR